MPFSFIDGLLYAIGKMSLISFDLNYNEDQNLLLNDLMKAGKIRSFDEKIPSMNEVFITAVSSPQSAISSL